MLEADALGAAASGAGRSAVGHERRRVVLEPGQPPRAVHPDAAQEADLADGGADVRRQPRAGGEHEQHVAGAARRARTTRTRPRRRRRRRRPPRRACASAALPQRAARHRPVPALPGLAPLARPARSPMPVTRTSLPGGAVVAVVNRWRGQAAGRARRAPRPRARPPGRQVEVSTVGSANTASSASAGWIDTSSATVTPRRRIQPQVENSDMYMWSSTKTWSRSTESRSR